MIALLLLFNLSPPFTPLRQLVKAGKFISVTYSKKVAILALWRRVAS